MRLELQVAISSAGEVGEGHDGKSWIVHLEAALAFDVHEERVGRLY